MLNLGKLGNMFSKLWTYFEATTANQWAATGVLLVCVVVLRWVLLNALKRSAIRSADLRRRWIVQIRNVSFVILAVGLVVIWASQLRAAALSVAAVLVSIVLATKELILCVSGGFLKVTSGSFGLGDRIVVKGVRGDVVDQTLLATRLLEIGSDEQGQHGTSRSVTIPNSVFLTEPVYNESFTRSYVLHTFTIPLRAGEDWERCEALLLEAAEHACAPFIEAARKHIARLTGREGFETPSVDPRVVVRLPEPGRIDLVIRVPAAADRKGFIEQDIIRRYLGARRAEGFDGEGV